MLQINSYGQTYDIAFTVATYAETENTAVELWCKGDWGWEPYARLTVNILPIPKGNACLDVNNLHGIEDWIMENNLGTPLGGTISSGFCEYPVYKLNMQEIEKHLLKIDDGCNAE